MRKEVFYLATCQTCQKIMAQVGVDDSFVKHEIKSGGISRAQVDEMKKVAGSYEALFSRRAMKFRSQGWDAKEKAGELTDADYGRLITEEYTFLKRPVFWIGERLFVGNAKKEVEGVIDALGS